MSSRVIRHEDYVAGCFDDVDLVVVGPRAGRPARRRPPQDRDLPPGRRRAARHRASRSSPSAWGTRCSATGSGIPLAFKDIVFQGTQSPVTIGGREERVGFYNTFVGRVGGPARAACPTACSVETDPATGDIHLVAGPHFRGVQFHAESILTENGVALLRQLLLDLVG